MKHLQEAISSSTPTLVVFRHAGDDDAADIMSMVETLKAEYAGRANVISVDSSYNGNVKTHFKLREYPTWVLYKEGQELMRESGKKSQAKLEEMIATAL
ncbi:MAG: thioredoxin family protein [Muribaculaceae bacterium]|nr:thioredoxin family protein [Muribaculaceae bacterium]